MTSVANYPGTHLPTIHLADRGFPDARLFFSPNELFLAKAPITQGPLVVWDLTTRERCLTVSPASKQETPFIPNGPGFAPDSASLVTCHSSELVRWHIPTQSPVWRCRVVKNQWGWGVDWLDYSPDGKQVIAILGKWTHLIVLDVETGKKLDTRRFAKSPCEPIGLICKPDAIQVCYLDDSQGHGKSRFLISDVLSNTICLSIDLSPDDCPILSPTYRLALIYRYAPSAWGEVWDLQKMKRMHLHKIPLPAEVLDMAIGFQDRFVATPFADRSKPSQLGQCTLEVWDLIEAKRVQHLERMMSCDIRWSAKSPLLAMSNHEETKPPLRNITLFIDPFAAEVRGHCYDHWGCTPETYRLSPSGRWLASLFATEYSNNRGEVIAAGTVAITDVSPILPMAGAKAPPKTRPKSR